MTPKEKAKELVDRFRIGDRNMKSKAKQCALICVDEILKNSLQLPVLLSTAVSEEIYWEEVKQEIDKL